MGALWSVGEGGMHRLKCHCEGQFASNEGIASRKPATGMTPRIRLGAPSVCSLSIRIVSSAAAVHGPEASSDAAGGKSKDTPGGTTVATKSTVLPAALIT